MPDGPPLPDPALVVLVGASGSGKSSWAARHYRAAEVVSSDALRGVVGSGRQDLDASADAFTLLDQIVAARVGRGLTTVVDTLGLDTARRREYLALARRHGMPAAAVVCDTSPALCRRRNAERDRPVPARVLADQLRAQRAVAELVPVEGWDAVLVVPDRATDPGQPAPQPAPAPPETAAPSGAGIEVVLQLSRFPWGEDPSAWLQEIATAADEAGFAGIALMDHLIQIPQVGTAWEPIPEPWVVLGLLAGVATRLRLGTLVTPATYRPAGITAKAVATLDAISGGRAFCGIGAGWWEREHLAFGLPFPPAAERLDLLEKAVETLRALWGPGTKPYAGEQVSLPETTCYPRPVSEVPVIVGGSGARSLRIAARLGDACNVGSDPEAVDRATRLLGAHCADVGRDPDSVDVTVLDLPVLGRDRDEVWDAVERHRGRTPAATYAARHHAGVPASHRERYERLAERGVGTVFVALPDLRTPEDVLAAAPMIPR